MEKPTETSKISQNITQHGGNVSTSGILEI